MPKRNSNAGTAADSSTPDEVTTSSQTIAKPNVSSSTDKLKVFIDRLQKLGVEIKLVGNYPWIYIDTINGKKVTERFQGNHGFTVAFLPVRVGQELNFTDIGEIFKLLRKYCC